ncbi:MAG: hypothetical protein WCS87_09875 [Methylococcaceae bacterium]
MPYNYMALKQSVNGIYSAFSLSLRYCGAQEVLFCHKSVQFNPLYYFLVKEQTR